MSYIVITNTLGGWQTADTTCGEPEPYFFYEQRF
jgi:hypothetical protein